MRKLWFARLAASKNYDPSCADKKGKCKGKTKGSSILVKKSGFGSVGPRDGNTEYKKMITAGNTARGKAGASGERGGGTAARVTMAREARNEFMAAAKAGKDKPQRVKFGNPTKDGRIKKQVGVGKQLETSKVQVASGTAIPREKEIGTAVSQAKNSKFAKFAKLNKSTKVPTKRAATKGVSKEESMAGTASNAKMTGNDKRRAGKTTSGKLNNLGDKLRNASRSATLKGKRPARQK